MCTTHLSACIHRNDSDLAQKIIQKTTKRHYRNNIEYRDILTHDNRHQLFLISPSPSHKSSTMLCVTDYTVLLLNTALSHFRIDIACWFGTLVPVQ